MQQNLDRLAPTAYSIERTFDSGLGHTLPRISQNGSRGFDRKLQHILRHAAKVFYEKGYEGASIRDISRLSGVSLSGLYYYFESKQKLLYLIQLNAFTRILGRLEKRLSGLTDPTERMQALIQNHLDYFLRHPVEMKVLSHEAEALEGPYRKEVAEIKRRYYAIALEVFEDLRRAGRVRRISPRIAVLSLFGMMNWIYTWHNPRLDPQADRLAETITTIFLEGVAVNGARETRPRLKSLPRADESNRARAAGS